MEPRKSITLSVESPSQTSWLAKGRIPCLLTDSWVDELEFHWLDTQFLHFSLTLKKAWFPLLFPDRCNPAMICTGTGWIGLTLTKFTQSKMLRNFRSMPWWYSANTIVFKSIRTTIPTSNVEWEVMSFKHWRILFHRDTTNTTALDFKMLPPSRFLREQPGKRQWRSSEGLSACSFEEAPVASPLSAVSCLGEGGVLPSKRIRRLIVSSSAWYETPVRRR